MIWVFAGTFDPITRGHASLIQRASRCCTRLLVAVAAESNKQTLFSADERLNMVQEALPEGVEALLFTGLLVPWAQQQGASVLVRGVRNSQDLVYEQHMAAINAHLGLETIWLPSLSQEALISSTLVKELARLEADLTPFVHSSVAKHLRKKLKNEVY